MRNHAILLVLAALIALSGAGTGSALAASSADKETRKQIETLFEEHPELVLDVLHKHAEEVLAIVQQGAEQQRSRAMQNQWERDLADPIQPEIEDDRIALGPENAPVTIVEYSDFQCPYCSKAAQTVARLMEEHEGTIRLFFKHMPLDIHPKAEIAARYFEAAALQDPAKAWKLHNVMFANRQELGSEGEEWLREQAKDLGLDVDRLAKDAQNEEITKRIAKDKAEARSFGMSGTPNFVINGVRIRGALPLDTFEEVYGLVTDKQ